MPSYVEHANISVTDLDASIRFFQTALPDFVVRHDSGPGPKRWVHLGTDTTYICLNQMPPPAAGTFAHHRPGFNHLGFVVDDAQALRERMLAAGYQEGYVPEPHPHRTRVYFLDPDGMEHEFVHYHSQRPQERHDYTQ